MRRGFELWLACDQRINTPVQEYLRNQHCAAPSVGSFWITCIHPYFSRLTPTVKKDSKTSIRIIDEPSRDEKSESRILSGHLDSHRSLVIKITRKKKDL